MTGKTGGQGGKGVAVSFNKLTYTVPVKKKDTQSRSWELGAERFTMVGLSCLELVGTASILCMTVHDIFRRLALTICPFSWVSPG